MIDQACLPLGYKLQFFNKLSSTNDRALNYIDQVAEMSSFSPLWLHAATQTNGKGTKGRAWVSSCDKNLYCSLLFQPECSLQHLSQLSLIAGVALFDAVQDFINNPENSSSKNISGLRLKWPNDLMIKDAKLAGILVETRENSTFLSPFAVIGTGLNLKLAPSLSDKTTTCFAHFGYDIKPSAALEKLSYFTDIWLNRWYRGAGFYDITNAWIERAGLLNARIVIETIASSVFQGECIGCNAAGQFLLKQQNKVIKIDFYKINSITL